MVLGLGVMGCAEIARRRTLPAIAVTPQVETVALASRDPAKASRFAAEFGGAPVTGYAALLDRPDVDAVYIALPPALHHVWAKRALLAGKHVLVEKPAVTGLREAEDLVATAVACDRRLTENFAFLHNPRHALVTRLLTEGAIGEPWLFSAVFGIPARDPGDIRNRADLGGGAMLDVGVYPVRAAQLHLGPELTVAGSVLDRGPDVDVGGAALLRSAAGVPAQLSFSHHSSYRSSYEICGRDGRITVDRAFAVPPDLPTTVLLERGGRTEEFKVEPADQLAALLAAFAEDVAARCPFTHEDGRAVLRQAALVEQIRGRS